MTMKTRPTMFMATVDIESEKTTSWEAYGPVAKRKKSVVAHGLMYGFSYWSRKSAIRKAKKARLIYLYDKAFHPEQFETSVEHNAYVMDIGTELDLNETLENILKQAEKTR